MPKPNPGRISPLLLPGTNQARRRPKLSLCRESDTPARYSEALSRENVKIALIEAAYEALAEGGLDRFLEFWTEDLDHRAIEGALDDRGPLHGREAMRAYVQDWMDTFDGLEIRPIELIDGGGNTVAAVLRFGGRAKLSGLATDSTFGVVFWIRDGKIARGREYATREQALEAAGLSE